MSKLPKIYAEYYESPDRREVNINLKSEQPLTAQEIVDAVCDLAEEIDEPRGSQEIH